MSKVVVRLDEVMKTVRTLAGHHKELIFVVLWFQLEVQPLHPLHRLDLHHYLTNLEVLVLPEMAVLIHE